MLQPSSTPAHASGVQVYLILKLTSRAYAHVALICVLHPPKRRLIRPAYTYFEL